MAFKSVPIIQRFIMLDVANSAEIIVNRQTFTLNAGKYQIDAKGGVWSLEVDESITVEYSPVKIEWLTSLSGVPVVGPLTDEQLRASRVPVIQKNSYKKITYHTGGQTQSLVVDALNSLFPDVQDYEAVRVVGFFGANPVYAIQKLANGWFVYYGITKKGLTAGSAVTIGDTLSICEE